jgi:predicted Ser/Thr protein kinase
VGGVEDQPEGEDTIMSTRVQLDASAIPRDRGAMPSRVGRFSIDRRVGSGGMGVVFEGHDPNLGRKVAIKLLHDSVHAQSRLLREAQALAQLTHENVVQVFEIDTSGDQVFVAMQFIEGRTLSAWVCERERSWQEIVDMFGGAAAGLAAAHAKGLVHRDFKPDNVLVGRDEVPRVLDFGLARAAGEVEAGEPSPAQSLSASSSNPMLAVDLTRTGSIMGTPAYMSPEQAAGEQVGAASDQFSFCVALFEALYGYRPFESRNLATLIANLQAGRVRPPPPDTKVPQWLHAALLRGLSLDPRDRFESVTALQAELASYRTASLRVGSKGRTAFMVVAFLVLLGALGGNVIAVRLFDQIVTPGSTLPGSAVAIVVLLGALLALRKELTRSGLNERIFSCLAVYIFYGPTVRLAAWRMDLSMDQMMPLEIIGGSLASFFFAFAFDRRMIWPAFAFFSSAMLCLLIPAAALELHALGHFAFFGYLCWVWYRDGLPGAQG